MKSLLDSVAAVQEVRAITDNAAALQLRVDKGSNQFLSTLAEPGEAAFLTVLKPCSILLPHVHQNAHEFYTVLFGAPLPHPPLAGSSQVNLTSLEAD
jgi:hypothetical protein